MPTPARAASNHRAGLLPRRRHGQPHGQYVLATEYLNASLQAPATRGERWAQTGQHAIERLTLSLNARAGAACCRLDVSLAPHEPVALANAVLDREGGGRGALTTLLEGGEARAGALEVRAGASVLWKAALRVGGEVSECVGGVRWRRELCGLGWARDGAATVRATRGRWGPRRGPCRLARGAGARGLSPPAGTHP